MAGKHWLSIPTIDNCALPRSLIDKCFDTYTNYGKYKLYDLINDDLVSTKYSLENRNKFKNIELIKRYLYLYRIAMIQTMSFVYNTDEFEMGNDPSYEGDNICPDCGTQLKILPRMGTTSYYPVSYYDDVIERVRVNALFEKKYIDRNITISLKRYVDTKFPSNIEGYKFIRWSKNENGEEIVNINDSIITHLESDGSLRLYASYASSLTIGDSDVLVDDTIIKTVLYVFNPTVKTVLDLYTDSYTLQGYNFSYFTLTDRDIDLNTEDGTNGSSDKVIDHSDNEYLNLHGIYIPDNTIDAYILPVNGTLRDLLGKIESSLNKENYIFDSFLKDENGTKISENELDSIPEFDKAYSLPIYIRYKYNVKEGTYAYGDEVYFCSTNCTNKLIGIKHLNRYIYNVYEPHEITVGDEKTLQETLNYYLDNYFDLNTIDQEFIGWSFDKENLLTNDELNRVYIVSRKLTIYAVYKNTRNVCPDCGKAVNYRGYKYNNQYVSNRLMKIYRYVNGQWRSTYVDGNNEKTYGYIQEVSNIDTLKKANTYVFIKNGTVCVDTSKYSDSSNSAYALYQYNSARDPNYNAGNEEYDDPDKPANSDAEWIVIPQNAVITVTDTTGIGKNNYKICGIIKCYLVSNEVVTVDRGGTIEFTFLELAKYFGIDTTVNINISHDTEKYYSDYTIFFKGRCINNLEYFDVNDETEMMFNKRKDILYAPTPKYKGDDLDKSTVTTWKDSDTYNEDGLLYDGGYPTVESSKITREHGPKEDSTVSYANNETVFHKVNDFELKPVSAVDPNSLIRMRSLTVENTEESIAEEIEETDDYGETENLEVRYDGWHLVSENTNVFFDIEATENDNELGISNGLNITNSTSTNKYLYNLLNDDEENVSPFSKDFNVYKFRSYSIDGYTDITDYQLNTIIEPGRTITVYRIYDNINPVNGIGLVEAIVFDSSDEEYAKNGFKRVLFPKEFNSSGSLIKYCTNPTCKTYNSYVRQRKWSFHNPDAVIKNTSIGTSFSNFSLDEYYYPNTVYKTEVKDWRYPQSTDGLTVMLHRGSSADIDKFRFDFETKYATNEFNANKGALKLNHGKEDNKSSTLQNVLMRIRGTNIVPIKDRPLSVYQNAYEDKLIKLFNEIYGKMIETNPYTQLNSDELSVIYDIIRDLPNEYKLSIMSFINSWNKYLVRENEGWDTENRTELIERINLNSEKIIADNIVTIGNKKYSKKALINSNIVEPTRMRIYTYENSPDTQYAHDVVPITCFIDPSVFTDPIITVRDVVETISNIPEYSNPEYRFVRLSLNELGTPITDIDYGMEVDKGTNLTVYAYYEYVNPDYLDYLNSDKHDKITETTFNSLNNFVRDYYDEDEFLSLTSDLLTEKTGLFTEGVSKSWYQFDYGSANEPISLEDFLNQYSDTEFTDILIPETISKYCEKIEYVSPSTTVTLKHVLDYLETVYNADEFAYWSFDGLHPITDNIRNDLSRNYDPETIITLYKVYDDKTITDFSFYNKEWYYGKEFSKNNLQKKISELHEKLALPTSFMCYIICIMIFPKRFIAITSSKGELASCLLSANEIVPYNSDSNVIFHKEVPNTGVQFDSNVAVLTKRFVYNYDSNTKSAIYEQYYINTTKDGFMFRVYSFLSNGWVDEIYKENASEYCFLLRTTENPASNYGPIKLLDIIPFSNDKYESLLIFIYDSCIVIFDCVSNSWLDRTIQISEIFESGSHITSCSFNNENNVLSLLSDKDEIASYNINENYYTNSNGINENNLDKPILIYYNPNVQNNTPRPTQFGSNYQLSSINTSSSESGEYEVIEDAVAAVQLINLEPTQLQSGEYEWIIKNESDVSLILPEGISNTYYESLSESDKSKYEINPILTYKYAYESVIDNLHYTDTITINGNKYNFARLSFFTYGISITNTLLNSRMYNSINLYAIYVKDGVVLPDNYGLALLNEQISVVKPSFIENNINNDIDNFGSKYNGYVEDYTLPKNIKFISYISGKNDEDKEYYPILAIVTNDNKVKIVRYKKNILETVITIYFEEEPNNDIVGITTSLSGGRVYIVYKNQKIVELQTYKYIPSVLQEHSSTGEEVVMMCKNSYNLRNIFITYYTNMNEIHNVKMSNDDFVDSRYYGRNLPLNKFLSNSKEDGLGSYLDCLVENVDFKFLTNGYIKWLTTPGEKYNKSQIN